MHVTVQVHTQIRDGTNFNPFKSNGLLDIHQSNYAIFVILISQPLVLPILFLK